MRAKSIDLTDKDTKTKLGVIFDVNIAKGNIPKKDTKEINHAFDIINIDDCELPRIFWIGYLAGVICKSKIEYDAKVSQCRVFIDDNRYFNLSSSDGRRFLSVYDLLKYIPFIDLEDDEDYKSINPTEDSCMYGYNTFSGFVQSLFVRDKNYGDAADTFFNMYFDKGEELIKLKRVPESFKHVYNINR